MNLYLSNYSIYVKKVNSKGVTSYKTAGLLFLLHITCGNFMRLFRFNNTLIFPYRGNHRRHSVNKDVLKNLLNFTGKRLC